ncbi:cytochrome P450 [Ceratobasidium sp. AG-I]|nr:cytochrome P450 [Ceratobasidium sp. AG-I]
MSEHFHISQAGTLWATLDVLVQRLRARPSESLLVAASIGSIGYVLKRLLTPSPYRNISGPPRSSFIYGHLFDIYSPLGIPFHDNLQDAYGSLCKLSGLVGPKRAERLYVSDPRALHEILVKENDHAFQRSQAFQDNLCFGPGLLGVSGIGHTFGVLQGVDSKYNHAIKSFLPALVPLFPFQPIMLAVYNMRPASWRRKIVEWIPHAGVQRVREIIDIQDEQAQTVLLERRRILEAHKGGEQPKDIMSILLQTNSGATENDQLPEEQLLGQMNTFILAGHETTSGALARVLHLLSMDQITQDRLRTELQAAPHNLDYNELHSLEYLDAICREVLRLYPPVPTAERDTLKDWIVPLRYPIKGTDGRMIREVEIKKGTIVVVGFREANRCKETWGEDADEFRPERWLEGLPSSAMGAKTPGIYSSMMTFSGGPRACIGFRFSLLELKVILLMLVRFFRFTPADTAVEWRLGQTMAPFEIGTKLGDLQPRLPLRVTMI